ncbi:MAG: hypothetical protein L0Y60_17060 [Beijerinckiaceae bacterium]|nr:hypothetical protein [Beijerinckiaceae bacterium]
MSAQILSPAPVLAEISRIESAFPAEFLDGFKTGLGVKMETREPGNYPAGFTAGLSAVETHGGAALTEGSSSATNARTAARYEFMGS